MYQNLQDFWFHECQLDWPYFVLAAVAILIKYQYIATFFVVMMKLFVMLLVIAVASCHTGLEDRQEHQDRQDLENLQDHQDRQDIKWVDNREWYHEDFAGMGCSKFTGSKKSCCRVNQNHRFRYRYHKRHWELKCCDGVESCQKCRQWCPRPEGIPLPIKPFPMKYNFPWQWCECK